MVRGRKPSVNYYKRRDWLERYRHGESPPSIAISANFDVRTVRKNIDLAQQEIEAAEGRTMVYRNAIQRHYDDLCGFVEKVAGAVEAEQTIGETLDRRMWSALRQHLPSSPLWRRIDRWNAAVEARLGRTRDLRLHVTDVVEKDSEVARRFAGRSILVGGLAEMLLLHLSQHAKGLPGIDLQRELHAEPSGDALVGRYGAFGLGPVRQADLAPIQKIARRLESALLALGAHDDLRKAEESVRSLKEELQDDLTTIALRRVVPGSCRYCPI